MKKKLEKLLRNGRVAENSVFDTLWTAYQAAETAYEKAKTDRKIAKSAFLFEREAARKDADRKDVAFELEMTWLKADGERLICRADFQLAKYRLTRWLDEFAREEKNSKQAAPQPVKKARTTRDAKEQPAAKSPRKKPRPKTTSA